MGILSGERKEVFKMGKIRALVVSGSFIVLFLVSQNVYAKEVPYTLEDRDRLIRIEISLKEFKEVVDKRFEQVDRQLQQMREDTNKRFEQVDKRSDGIERRLERLETVMMWGFGLLFTSMLGMVGFVLWDRRTAVAPVTRVLKEVELDLAELKRRGMDVERREIKIEDVLREYARKEPGLAELMRIKGMM